MFPLETSESLQLSNDFWGNQICHCPISFRLEKIHPKQADLKIVWRFYLNFVSPAKQGLGVKPLQSFIKQAIKI